LSPPQTAHRFYKWQGTCLAISINGILRIQTISINGKGWVKSNLPALPVSEQFLVFILYQMLIQTFETLAQ
jgi:hypothetical protein